MFNYYANIRSAMIRLPSLIMLIAVIGLPIQAIAQGCTGTARFIIDRGSRPGHFGKI